MKKLIIGSLILILFGSVAMASSDTPSAPDPSLAAYGARPLGMGGAFVAVADDANAIFSNPAGLSTISEWSLTSMSTQLLQKVDYTLVGGTYRIGPGTLGIGYIGTSSTAGYKYNEYGTQESSSPIAYTSSLILISYGLDLSKAMDMGSEMGMLAVGATAKMISKGFSDIDDASASGMDLDLGLTFRPNDSPFSLGAAIKNLADGSSVTWKSGSKENLERSLKAGASAKLSGEGGLYKLVPGDLFGSIDIELRGDGKPMVFHVGSEYKPIKYLAIRLGVDQDPVSEGKTSTSLTAGVGVEYLGFNFDYAYRVNPDASELSNHYFSLSYAPEALNGTKDADKKEAKLTKENKETKKEKKSSKDDIYQLPEEYQNISIY